MKHFRHTYSKYTDLLDVLQVVMETDPIKISR